MEKIEWKTTRLSLAEGEQVAEKDINVPPGKRVVAAAVTGQAANQLVNMGLFENGNEISTPADLKFWERSNAGLYLDGFRPLSYKGGSNITVRVSSPKPMALATGLDVEIVFGIISESETC